jgi:hypothetical protein
VAGKVAQTISSEQMGSIKHERTLLIPVGSGTIVSVNDINIM